MVLFRITGGRLAQLRERMRSIQANAIALSGPPLIGNSASLNFRLTPGGLAKWWIGCAAHLNSTSGQWAHMLPVSTPTAISLSCLLCDVCPDEDNTNTRLAGLIIRNRDNPARFVFHATFPCQFHPARLLQ